MVRKPTSKNKYLGLESPESGEARKPGDAVGLETFESGYGDQSYFMPFDGPKGSAQK